MRVFAVVTAHKAFSRASQALSVVYRGPWGTKRSNTAVAAENPKTLILNPKPE